MWPWPSTTLSCPGLPPRLVKPQTCPLGPHLPFDSPAPVTVPCPPFSTHAGPSASSAASPGLPGTAREPWAVPPGPSTDHRFSEIQAPSCSWSLLHPQWALKCPRAPLLSLHHRPLAQSPWRLFSRVASPPAEKTEVI